MSPPGAFQRGQLAEVSVFVSSPGDVQAERRAVAEIVQRHNDQHGAFHRYVIKVARFEGSAAPGVGAPMQVVYEQMGRPGQYDLVVCILGATLGTPDVTDSRRRTGTQQELEAAISACRASGRPEVMLYIKGPTSPDVARYLEGLTGQLLWAPPYESLDAFKEQFERHLLQWAQRVILTRIVPVAAQEGRNMLRRRMSQYWFEEENAFRGLHHPVAVSMRLSVAGQEVIASTASMPEIYEHAMQGRPRVALVGTRGAGKTFALLALAELMTESPRPGVRVPVYLAATDWLPLEGGRERSIRDWLIDELHATYKLKRSGARQLLDDDAVIPFIDGLDELLETQEEDRADRFSAFCRLLREWARKEPFVIACESQVWTSQGGELVQELMTISMLPFEDPSAALADRPELQVLLEENTHLRELCRTPLGVSLLRRLDMHIAGVKVQVRGIKSEWDALRVLLENAFDKDRPASRAAFSEHERHSALARIGSTLLPGGSFKIEDLQPTTFPVGWLYRLYASVGLALLVLLMVAIPSFASLLVERQLAGHVAGGYVSVAPILESLQGAALAGVVGALLVGLGMSFARGWFAFALAIGTAFGCARGIVLGFGLLDNLKDVAGAPHGQRVAAITSVIFALVTGVIFYGQRFSPMHIRPLKVRVGEVKTQFKPAAMWAVPAGLGVAVVFGLLFGLARAISFGILVLVAVETILVVSSTPMPKVVRPNQGILVSLETSLRIGAATLVAGPLCFGLGYLAISWESAVVNAILGLNVILVVLMCGALPVIQHYALRLALAKRGLLPVKLVDFCDECHRQGVLKRAGNRYRFVHEYVRRYFIDDLPRQL